MKKIKQILQRKFIFLKGVFLIIQKIPFDCLELLGWYGTRLKQAYDEILVPYMDPLVSDKKRRVHIMKAGKSGERNT